jgi:hypothetical protein
MATSTPNDLAAAGFPSRCAQYQGAPHACEHPVREMPGHGIHCEGCRLHPDLCTCGRDFPVGFLTRLIVFGTAT